MTATRIALIVLAALALAPAHAQQAAMGDSAKDMLGAWEFSNADHDKRCTATFKNAAVKGGFKVEFDANCANLFPFVADIAGWRYPENDNLFLFDAGGRTLAEFSEVESGMFEAPTPGVGVLFLQNAAAAAPPPKKPEEVAGDWVITATGPLCEISLSTTVTGDGMKLTIKPGCSGDIARQQFGRWRIDGGELLLLPEQGGTPWRFVENDTDTWQRIPESATPMSLVRK